MSLSLLGYSIKTKMKEAIKEKFDLHFHRTVPISSHVQEFNYF